MRKWRIGPSNKNEVTAVIKPRDVPLANRDKPSPARRFRARAAGTIGVLLAAALAFTLSSGPANALIRPTPSVAVPLPITVPPLTRVHSLGPHRGVLFGGSSPLMAEQSKIGHLGIVRLYYTLGEKFTGPLEESALRNGSTLLVSLDDPPRSGVKYTAITSGYYDKVILAFLKQVEQAAVQYKLPTIYFAFEHEANGSSHQAIGTAAQFVAAYNHVHALAARARLNWNDGGHLRWALILEHIAYFPASQRTPASVRLGFASQFWPGSDVNLVAADGYNYEGCTASNNKDFLQTGNSMMTPAQLFDPVLAFARSHGHLPVIIAEWGSISYTNPAIRPRFIRDMQRFVLNHPAIKAVSYWDSSGGDGRSSTVACNTSVNQDPRSLAALATMNRAIQAVDDHSPPPWLTVPPDRSPRLTVPPDMRASEAAAA
jgi:hypothetical protein